MAIVAKLESFPCGITEMDSENTPDSSSFTASSTSSSPEASAADRASRKKSKCGTDLMVRIELEAAEALADLAQSAVRKRENSSAESGGQWGSQGKRACKRLKDDCPVIDSEKAVHKSSELAKVCLLYLLLVVC